MESTKPDCFQFGGFRLDRRRRLLLDADGSVVRVTAKAFDALVYFLDHPGHVIERSTLLEALWPNTIVEENNLSQTVAALRRLLGDGFIVTVTGRGYQFVADVREVTNDDAGAATTPAAAPDSSGLAQSNESSSTPAESNPRVVPAWLTRRRRYAASVVIGLAAALAGAYAYYAAKTSGPRTTVDVEAALDATRGTTDQPRANTLAVLPLLNLSSDRAQEFFTDGLTDELINHLARIEPLQVTSRTSSFVFKGSNRSVKDIARVLGVRHVLEGSVAKSENKLRVRVQLVDAALGHNVWSQSFDRELHDVLAIQEEIAVAVTRSVLGPLGVGARVTAIGASGSTKAFELYLAAKGNTNATSLTYENVTRGLEQIEEALKIDSSFARAWVQKSRLLNQMQVMRGSPVGEAQAGAERAARRAIELEPELGLAHTALAAALMTRRERLGAETEFRKGIALGNWEDVHLYGLFLLSVGHVTRAREYLLIARARDPLNAFAAGWTAAAYDSLGDAAAALAVHEHGRRLFARWDTGLATEAIRRVGTGDPEQVRALPQLYPEYAELWKRYSRLFDALDDRAKAMSELRRLYYEPDPNQSALLASAAMLGQAQFAVEEFINLNREQSGVGSSPSLLWAAVFSDMRRLPRFKDLVRDEGFLDYWNQYGWPDHCRPIAEHDFECF